MQEFRSDGAVSSGDEQALYETIPTDSGLFAHRIFLVFKKFSSLESVRCGSRQLALWCFFVGAELLAVHFACICFGQSARRSTSVCQVRHLSAVFMKTFFSDSDWVSGFSVCSGLSFLCVFSLRVLVVCLSSLSLFALAPHGIFFFLPCLKASAYAFACVHVVVPSLSMVVECLCLSVCAVVIVCVSVTKGYPTRDTGPFSAAATQDLASAFKKKTLRTCL